MVGTFCGRSRVLKCASLWLGWRSAVKGAGSSGATESLRRQPIDPTTVVRQVAPPRKPRYAESKGLASHASGEHRTLFSGSVGRASRVLKNAPEPVILSAAKDLSSLFSMA
jgi:hypothetical protein